MQGESLVGEPYQVLVITGSGNDCTGLKKLFDTLVELQITFRAHVCSAHRDPERLRTIIADAERDNVIAIICAAGMAAHLPGVVASLTTLPVIGLPLSGGIAGAWDALLAIVQMPPGVPVLTVGVDASVNAAVAGAQLVALQNPQAKMHLQDYRDQARSKNQKQDIELHEWLESNYK